MPAPPRRESSPAAPRISRVRRRFILIAGTLGVLGQLPGAALLYALIAPRSTTAAWAAVLGVCTAATVPLGIRLRLGITDRSETGPVAWALYVFYVWWATSLVAGVLAPIALPVAWLCSQPTAVGCAAALAVGLATAVAGVSVKRTHARLRQVEVHVPGLPAGLDGYRIAQLSDIHMGAHTPAHRVRGWVDRVNALAPDLVAVTGDVITSGDRFIDAVADELGRLRGRDGVAFCMGNHEYFGDHARLVAGLERGGIEVLRNRGRVVSRDGARYWLAGVDDTWQKLADVGKALAGRPEDAPAIVLAHDPDLFDECARLGATLVLSGHTHGGQLALPFFARTINAARIGHRYTVGSYRLGDAHLFVTRGAGTTGPPLRIGSPSEIALITLRAA